MKKLIISLLLIFCHFYSVAQIPIQWQKSLGGASDDLGWAIQQTIDGGYILAGFTQSSDGDVTGNHGILDYWIVKLDIKGEIQWQKSLGGKDIEYAKSIQQTTDGGYIVAGYSGSNDGDVTDNHGLYDFWIVKLDSAGTIQWQKSLGGTSDDIARSIQQTNDGGYIIAGESFSNDGDVTGNHGGLDYWIVKLDSLGEIRWQKTLGGTGEDAAYSIQQINEGGYIVAGESRSNDGDVSGNHGNLDYWIVKLDSIGTIQWQKSLGGTDNEYANSIKQTTDSGYIVAGYSGSNDDDVSGNHGAIDYWIVKMDSIGTIQWQKSLGGTSYDYAWSIQQTTDEGYVVAGGSYSNDGDVTGNHGDLDYWIAKLDSIGTMQWQKSFGGTYNEYAYSVLQTTDGGYIIAGDARSNNGDVSGNHGDADSWIVKLSATVSTDEQNHPVSLFSRYPNPANNFITIETKITSPKTFVSIYNISGQKISEQQITNPKTQMDISNLPTGVYVIKLQNEKMVEVGKLIKN